MALCLIYTLAAVAGGKTEFEICHREYRLNVALGKQKSGKPISRIRANLRVHGILIIARMNF